MDIGCYCVNFSRLVAGSEPARVTAHAHWDAESGVDLTLTGMLEFGDGVTAQFASSLEGEGVFGAEIVGTDGKIVVPHPWLPPATVSEVTVVRSGQPETLRFELPAIATPFAAEIEHFAGCVRTGNAPLITEHDSRGNACVIDALLASARTHQPVEPAR
jgi:predicted dehydrogenase